MSRKIFSEFFRSRNLLETAWYGTTAVTRNLVSHLVQVNQLKRNDTLAAVCDIAYSELFKSSSPEYAYKNILISKTVFGTYSPQTTSWLYEFKVGSARADAIKVKGMLATAFEIKTELDDFSRAKNQLESYYSCFDQVIFLVGQNQLDKAIQSLPEQVGILTLSKRKQLSKVRAPISYRERLSSESMFYLFHNSERAALESKYGISTQLVPPIERYAASRDAVAKINPHLIYEDLVRALGSRAKANKRAKIADELPASLRAAVFGYRIKNSEWKLLADRLKEPAINVL